MAANAANQVVRARQPTVSAGTSILASKILASKITVPSTPRWAVQRPRITKLIAEGTRWCQLTVVTGHAGAGKTMALAMWAAAARPGTVAWISVDDFDNRPGVFWVHVVAALRQAGVAAPRALPTAAQERPGDYVFLLRLASALASKDTPVTLVVDDLHVLAEPLVLNGLDFLLRNVGYSLRLVLSSRTDPPLPGTWTATGPGSCPRTMSAGQPSGPWTPWPRRPGTPASRWAAARCGASCGREGALAADPQLGEHRPGVRPQRTRIVELYTARRPAPR
jgi:hypothetical protein